jgi:hypothetical protein
MSYRIDFNVVIQGVYRKDKEKLAEDMRLLCPEFVESLESSNHILPLGSYDSEELWVEFVGTWPDRQEELGDLTFKYPDIEIMVSCDGEDGYQWQEKYQNGECSTVDFGFRDEW